jgi:virginiamycin B lyase
LRALSKRAPFASVAKVIEVLEQRQLLSAVTAFPIPGQSADSFSWNGSAHITTGPDGNLWFTDSGNNQIDRVTPQGQITPFTLPGSDDPSPDGIVAGPDGNLWFTESGVDRIGRISPTGTITEFETPTADSNPTAIAVGSDGNLWFAESGTNDIGKITPTGKITEYPTTNLDLSSTDNMVKGPGGDVWFIAADSDGNSEIARVTTAGKVTAFPLTASSNDLTVGPDGNVWLASSGEIDDVAADGTVQSFTIPTGDDASAITTGPDGALWFALDGTNQLGRMTVSGTFSEYALPEPGATDGSTVSIGALTSGPDGNFWFTDDSTPQVGQINLSGALLAGGDAATVTAGTASSATLASFTDFSGGAAADYTATVTWSDNTTSAGTITVNSSGGFDVSASRDWTLNDYSATVTITDIRNTTRTATTSANLTVSAPQATGTGVTLTTTAAQLFTGTVASFTGVALNSLSQYSATIDWGDGQVSNGTIAANGTGGIDVSGSNRYAASGSYTVTVNLSPYPGGFLYPLGGGEGIVPVAIGAPVAKTVSANPGVAKATATAPGSAIAKSATSSAGVISTPIIPTDPLPPISDPGFATATSTMTVAAGVMDGTGFTIEASSTAPFSGNVASFKLTDPSADLSHLHATITWSDPWVYDWFTCSTPPTTGTITSDGNGSFTVSVATNFANYGLSHFTVSITDDRITTGDATVGVAYGQLCVDSPIRWLPVLEGSGANTPAGASATIAKTAASSAAANVNPVLSEQVAATSALLHPGSGGTIAGNLGTLTGVTSTVAKLADLHGTINWGDGTTSAATFVKGAKGRILVRGNHKYSQTGGYSINVSAEQTLYTNGKASALYPLALPAIAETATVVNARPITTGGVAISATAGQPFSGAVASFALSAHAVPSTQAATIFWGDGSHSAGTIDVSGNELTVSGSHTYRKAGKYHVRVIVTQHSTQAGARLPLILANICDDRQGLGRLT